MAAAIIVLWSCSKKDGTTPATTTSSTSSVTNIPVTAARGMSQTVDDIRINYGKSDGASNCIGKGICNISKATGTTPPTPGSIHVAINGDPIDQNVLIFTFKKSDLLNAGHPDQVAFFTDPSRSYNFDADFPLTDPIFDPLALEPNSRITTNSLSNVFINGDIITLRITYIHD